MRFTWLLLMMAPVAAEAQEPATLQSAMGSVAGQEVTIDGYIGTGLNMMDNEELGFRSTEGTVFSVVFDAGREARGQLEGCRFQIFGGGTPCRMKGQAELEWSGSQLRLIIFEVGSIESPANLP